MTNQVFNIANYIISYLLKDNRMITHIHLQKSLYFLQSYYLVEKDQSLFRDQIERWKLGPVVPNVYQELRGYGLHPIHKTYTEIIVKQENFKLYCEDRIFKESDLEEDLKDELNPLIDALYEYEAEDLLEKSCNQTIWNKYRDEIYSEDQITKKRRVYSIEEIKDYYSYDPYRKELLKIFNLE